MFFYDLDDSLCYVTFAIVFLDIDNLVSVLNYSCFPY